MNDDIMTDHEQKPKTQSLKTVCVYCASSNNIGASFFEMAEEAGRLLAERGYTLVYGGGNVGLMGVLAKSVHEHGGRVVGVIPEALKRREGIAYQLADELIITRTMQERKSIMFSRAEAFMVLPGGFGTLEEFMEVLTLKQLGYHHPPIALVNTDGFYEPLIDLFAHIYAQKFAHPRHRELYHVATDPKDAIDYIEVAMAVRKV